ncbi:hypothetical protein B0I31_13124 [Saccharothrix carnea]|uniref:Uncharacterized protein n=1 Tax=Saccharothrix carnea TaxID=1280637 RepID=A0A2P8HBC5_SACCR|nr:hypothetical protein [Saccharothrix carnea]PSL43523.1 hypothetical protein B0I31_13124 [Saccharothrix carnea]
MAGRPDSVDWHAVPGDPHRYEPDVIEPGLRGLAEATGLVAAGGHAVLGDVRLELPVDPGGTEVCVRLFDVEPGALPARAVLLPAGCGRGVH